MQTAIVHLSDIHFRAGANILAGRIKQLANAVCSTDPTCTEYLIILTGDIANTGIQEEYRIAARFLGDLALEIRSQLLTCLAFFNQ